MAALLYLPCGAVSEEGGSVGRAWHQGESAARGLSSTTCKERAKTPRLRGSRSSGQSPFHASAPPQPPPPPIQGHMPLHAHLQQWALTSCQGCKPSIQESGWLRALLLGCAGILSAHAPLHAGPNSTLWAHPEQVWHPVSQWPLRDLKTVTLGPSSLLPLLLQLFLRSRCLLPSPGFPDLL